MIGETAAVGTRNAPNYVGQSPASTYGGSTFKAADNRRSHPQSHPPIRMVSAESQDRTSGIGSPPSTPDRDNTLTSNEATSGPEQGIVDDTTDVRRSYGEILPGPWRNQGQSNTAAKPLLVSDASEAPSLEGIIDVQNTTKTIVHTKHEPGKLQYLNSIQAFQLLNLIISCVP